MTKVGGSLGFTLRKADSSALGHYIRALVREPALSDGRIRPGDKIVAVDGAPLSPMSHEEAVQLLRQCGPTVKLRLYRDLAQTPVSALSPTEPDHPLRPPRTSLRYILLRQLEHSSYVVFTQNVYYNRWYYNWKNDEFRFLKIHQKCKLNSSHIKLCLWN